MSPASASAPSTTALRIALAFPVANRAFTHEQPPQLVITLDGATDGPQVVELELVDLLSGDSRSLTTVLGGQERASWTAHPRLPYGVFRACVRSEGVATVEGCFAYAPAAPIDQLPDDWPFASHVTSRHPIPLPGFRWFRHFSHWSANNPAPGRYDWSRLDPVYHAVKAAGGRLMIADDGAPLWACSRGKVGMHWMAQATAYPPDELSGLQHYLEAMRERYADGSGTLAAWEVWNEANTEDRYRGSPQQLVEIAKVYRAVAQHSEPQVKVVGIAVSAGPHEAYVRDLVAAGILDQLDAISGHFYEELHSYEAETPINNLPRHVALLKDVLQDAHAEKPVINSESGIAPVERRDGRIPTQAELQAEAEADPALDRDRPWMIGRRWRRVSEFRGAAGFVAGVALLAASGVSPSFTYHNEGWMLDDAPSLYWVAMSVFGDHLRQVDHRRCAIIPAQTAATAAAAGISALACRFGDPAGRTLTVVWAYRRDPSVGRSKLWQDWLDPVPVTLEVCDRLLRIGDLYGRNSRRVEAAAAGTVQFAVGEEPCFVLTGD